jgi:hypothetical protein
VSRDAWQVLLGRRHHPSGLAAAASAAAAAAGAKADVDLHSPLDSLDQVGKGARKRRTNGRGKGGSRVSIMWLRGQRGKR